MESESSKRSIHVLLALIQTQIVAYGMKLFVMNRMMAVTRLHTIEWIEFGAI